MGRAARVLDFCCPCLRKKRRRKAKEAAGTPASGGAVVGDSCGAWTRKLAAEKTRYVAANVPPPSKAPKPRKGRRDAVSAKAVKTKSPLEEAPTQRMSEWAADSDSRLSSLLASMLDDESQVLSEAEGRKQRKAPAPKTLPPIPAEEEDWEESDRAPLVFAARARERTIPADQTAPFFPNQSRRCKGSKARHHVLSTLLKRGGYVIDRSAPITLSKYNEKQAQYIFVPPNTPPPACLFKPAK